MLSISVWKSIDGSIRIMLVSTASFSFLWGRVGHKLRIKRRDFDSIFNTVNLRPLDFLSGPKIQNLPDSQEKFIHLLHLWQAETCEVAKAVQLGVQV